MCNILLPSDYSVQPSLQKLESLSFLDRLHKMISFTFYAVAIICRGGGDMVIALVSADYCTKQTSTFHENL